MNYRMRSSFPWRIRWFREYGGQVITTIFLAIFFVGGAALTWVMARTNPQIRAEQKWPVVPCTVVHRAIKAKDLPNQTAYAFTVAYRYEWAGRQYVGTAYQIDYDGTEDIADVERLMDQYSTGSVADCFVNPVNPTQAVLHRRPAWWEALILIPIAIALAAAIAIVAVWRYEPSPARESSGDLGRRIRNLIFGVVFGGGGIAVLLGFVVPTLREYFAAKSWPAVHCTVESSRLAHDSDADEGTHYYAQILIHYYFAGRIYRDNQYDLRGMSNGGGRETVQTIVDAHPPAHQPSVM